MEASGIQENYEKTVIVRNDWVIFVYNFIVTLNRFCSNRH